MGELRGSDLTVVREQLGRQPTTPFTVVDRCPDGHPLVIRNHPLDADGRPFPTLFWLTCPTAVKMVSRLESEGAIGRFNSRADEDLVFAAELATAHESYSVERSHAEPEARAWGGVGGTRTGVKCLHAHYAFHLAGGADPVGAWVAEQVEPLHVERRGRVAVIDQGTNSIRLLVVEPTEDGFRDLSRDMVITRLGQEVDRTGQIAPDALRRTVDVLATYCRRARALHAERIRVGATSAVRDATNREGYATEVRRHAGSDLEVIPGEHEADLSFLGATHRLEEPGPYLVLDIGGGSTEFVVGERTPLGSISTQMGSVRLTERFLTTDPPSTAELEAAAAAIHIVLDDVATRVPIDVAITFVAVSGTATTIQALALGLPFYDPERIHRTWLSLQDAEAVLADLVRMSNPERAALPVMAPGRGDVIVMGGLVLTRAMRAFGFERVLVSETDILDGLALELLDVR